MATDPDRARRKFGGSEFAERQEWSEKEIRQIVNHEMTIALENHRKQFYASVGSFVLEGHVGFEENGQDVKVKVDYTDVAAFLYQNLGPGSRVRVTVQQVENGKATH